MRTPARFLLALAPLLLATTSAQAAPQRGPQARTDAALNAAYGTPPPQATFSPDTRAEPGFVDTARTGPADQAYKSSAQGVDAEGNAVEGVNFYDEDLYMPETGYVDTTPEFHIVQQGDTLWAISQVYLRDPYLWPKLWSFNEHITNAHWIFPGDRIRLTDPYGRDDRGPGALEPEAPQLSYKPTDIPVGRRGQTYMLNQHTFVDAEQFDLDMEVIGGSEAKVMMATLDTVYMDYAKKRPPIPGERLVVYTPQEVVRNLKGREILGYLVQIVGEVEVQKVARESAEGLVADSFNAVERGYKVGPLRRKFRRIDTVAAERSEVGRIIATVNTTGFVRGVGKAAKKKKKKQKRSTKRKTASEFPLAGEDDFVIVDMGADKGVKVGNVLEIVRKGDELTEKNVFHIPYEDGWPRRISATALVVEVNEKTCFAVVTFSRREIERGDYVELRGPGLDDTMGPDGQRRGLETTHHAEGRAGKGKAEGSAGFKLGN